MVIRGQIMPQDSTVPVRFAMGYLSFVDGLGISTSPPPPPPRYMARNKNPGGRKKIEIKRIGTEEARQVCFSKRRTGLFKKACELCILCGAEVVIVVYSPAGRPYSFGGPEVSVVADRFLSPGDPSTSYPARRVPAAAGGAAAAGWRHREDPSDLRRALAAEKRNRAALEGAFEAARRDAGDVNKMELDELEAMERTLLGLRAEVAVWTSEIVLEMDRVSWGGAAPPVDPAVAGSYQEVGCSGVMDSAFRFF
ncbi:hypothetical protein Taro_043342 [Colocasia esculenta]|uniref:MADS-box domain-containing protein n=1 Tax=Colocasia esculenta TaxID=4460 RepID=A0A843WRU7_COLES|nr:hypothetical protein [Colocasia esculenta]